MTDIKTPEEIKDWIETCLDADAHGKWHRAPKFAVIEDVAELMAPRIAHLITAHTHSLEKTLREEIEAKCFQINVHEYLPLVENWDKKNFDVPFDHGYAQGKKDALAIITARLSSDKK